MKTNFKIEHIDPLGQGVSRLNDQVTFIGKTLPEETGQAKVIRRAKGVQFAFLEDLKDLEKRSDLRIKAECPHFMNCNGCHFLHTSYEVELESKKQSFLHQARSLEKRGAILPALALHPAEKRLGYRNRIQLHYDTNLGKLGFIDPHFHNIVEIPHCLIALPAVKNKLQELYQGQSWTKLLRGAPRRGHLEIYQQDNGEVQVKVNAPYSFGGFSQVNEVENQKLLTLIETSLDKLPLSAQIVDLFGGKGNLSRHAAPRTTAVIDYSAYTQKDMLPHQNYHQLDLFSPKGQKELLNLLPEKIDLLLIDPPRSGFKELFMLSQQKKIEKIIYVSCNFSSQLRDLTALMKNYQVEEMHLYDFFPSTYHFESLIMLSKKS